MLAIKSELKFVKFLKKINKKKLFILTGSQSYIASGMYNYINRYLLQKNYKLFFKKETNPTITELKKIIYKIKNYTPDYILAVGGGSVMDYAKAANCFDDLKKLNYHIKNPKKKFKKNANLIAIPTTAGTGSEVTPGAVIYINKIKYSVEGKEIVPDDYFLIPNLVISNSKKLRAASGFDALSQSIESLFSRKSSATSVNYAKQSLKILFKYYILHLEKPSLNTSFKMLIAANLSGKAISISKTTAPHAVSYPFTAHFGISHGNAVSLTLNEFLIFNYKNLKKSDVKFNLKKRFEILFKLSKTKSINELVNFIEEIKRKAKTEASFKKIKLPSRVMIPKILSGINIDRLSNNPVKLSIEDVRKIIESKFALRK